MAYNAQERWEQVTTLLKSALVVGQCGVVYAALRLFTPECNAIRFCLESGGTKKMQDQLEDIALVCA